MNPQGNWFSRHPDLSLLAIFLLYCAVSTMDYQDARQSECERSNQSYNKESDKCQ